MRQGFRNHHASHDGAPCFRIFGMDQVSGQVFQAVDEDPGAFRSSSNDVGDGRWFWPAIWERGYYGRG